MTEIKFDLGKSIVDTARASGASGFQVGDTAGLIDYSVDGIPNDVAAHYVRQGYEISWRPIFAFTMYADREISPNLLVDSVRLQFDNRTVKTHAQAQALVEQAIAQFQAGKWQRYHDPEWDVLLTGRSSLLDEHGNIGIALRTIDPAYKISAEDWASITSKGATWRWMGDGVLASLDAFGYESSTGLDYTLGLTFALLSVALRRDAENLARELKAGDAKGWNSTAEYETDKNKRAALNRRLIENAIQRGDTVVRPTRNER